ISNLNEISQKIASGKATYDMPARLNYMLQLTTSLEGGDELADSIREVTKSAEMALRGYSKSLQKQKILKHIQLPKVLRDDKAFRDECAHLAGISDIIVVANCLIAMSARLGV
ncbi:hypothetical protein ACHU3V_004663, partial [Escherichia coli]